MTVTVVAIALFALGASASLIRALALIIVALAAVFTGDVSVQRRRLQTLSVLVWAMRPKPRARNR